jgi:hypothetical protein
MEPEASLDFVRRLVSRYRLPLKEPEARAHTQYKGDITNKQYDVDTARAKSVWFNKHLALSNATLMSQVMLITELMDWTAESLMGYSVTTQLLPMSWSDDGST